MHYRFLVKDVTPQRLIVQRARTSRFDWGTTLETLLEGVWRYLNSLESVTAGPPMARFHPLDAATVEIEAGFPVAESIAPAAEFEVSQLPDGRAATTLLEGPYERLSDAETALREWMMAQGLVADGPPWIIFWVTPEHVDLLSELRSEIVCVLAPRTEDPARSRVD